MPTSTRVIVLPCPDDFLIRLVLRSYGYVTLSEPEEILSTKYRPRCIVSGDPCFLVENGEDKTMRVLFVREYDSAAEWLPVLKRLCAAKRGPYRKSKEWRVG